jgi:RNA polymerase sigma factor FliA
LMAHALLGAAAPTYTRKGAGVDPEAMVKTHAPLVRRLAWAVHSRMSSAIEVEDLVQIGMIALIEAAKTFEERGVAFSHYASTRARGAMIDHLRKEARTARSGSANRRNLARARTQLEADLGRSATDAEMAANLNLEPTVYFAMVASTLPAQQDSIEDIYSDQDWAFADRSEAADVLMVKQEEAEALAREIKLLSEREAIVLQLYFVEELNLDEIGAVLDVGAARICQIKRAAMDKLRVRLSPK